VKPESAAGWNGPYLKGEIPMDPWKHPYQYAFPVGKGDVQIKSLGKDGRPGGVDENADISN
jgi:general secretion pathway protein G